MVSEQIDPIADGYHCQSEMNAPAADMDVVSESAIIAREE
jgi:hypothetical protein